MVYLFFVGAMFVPRHRPHLQFGVIIAALSCWAIQYFFSDKLVLRVHGREGR